MQKYFDINEDGFSIRCKLYYQKDLHALPHIVIATYGFGGNMDNKAVEKFAERLTTKYHGYGVVCFDWPCHGKDARNKLILDECCTYLDLVTCKGYAPCGGRLQLFLELRRVCDAPFSRSERREPI